MENNMVNIQELTEHMTMLSHQAEQGLTDPKQVYTYLYTIKKVAEELSKEILDVLITDLEKYGKEEVTCNGYKLSVQSRKNWKFGGDNELERLEFLAKNRKEMMKKASVMQSKGSELFDENGELITPAEYTETTFAKLEVLR